MKGYGVGLGRCPVFSGSQRTLETQVFKNPGSQRMLGTSDFQDFQDHIALFQSDFQ